VINISRAQLWTALVVVVAALLLAFPNVLGKSVVKDWPRWVPHQVFNLGLDLRGGAYLLVEVDMQPVLQQHFVDIQRQLRTTLRSGDARLRFDDLRILQRERPSTAGPVRVAYGASFRVVDAADLDKAADVARRVVRDMTGTSGLLTSRQDRYAVAASGERVTITITDAGETAIRDRIIDQSMEIVRRRVDPTGTAEVGIQRQGTERIIIEVPGIEKTDDLKNRLNTAAKMTFHLPHPSIVPSETTVPPVGYKLYKGKRGENPWHLLLEEPELDGKHLADAQQTFQEGRPIIQFRLDTAGARIFCKITRDNIRKPFAIVLDNEVLSAPVIQSEICGGQGIIQGGFTIETAGELALLLRAGALPAPLKVVEERTVGPGLGADAIEAGIWTSILGVALVFFFMATSYGLFGGFATVSLLLNLTILAAVMSLLQATLTLPGIAGIVLSLGMSVDANVLIYERMREEARAGRTSLSAIDAGFSRAFTAISDSNITSIITGILMYLFGSGPVKGFGVTLAIGVGASFFTAVMLTRIQVVYWWRWKRPKQLPI
jgi:preprotein translocase subunit SecD